MSLWRRNQLAEPEDKVIRTDKPRKFIDFVKWLSVKLFDLIRWLILIIVWLLWDFSGLRFILRKILKQVTSMK